MAIFGAQGIRDAMKNSYQKHLHKLAGTSLPGETSLHHASLYGALATRYTAGFESQQEMDAWTELAPFLNLPDGEAVVALAEYVVLKEMPEQADIETLTLQLRRGWSLVALEEREAFKTMAEMNNYLWLSLIR